VPIDPATNPGPVDLLRRLRPRGWGLLLPILGLQYAILTTQPAVRAVELTGACLITVFAPRLATRAVPFALLLFGGIGLMLAARGDASPFLYGLVLVQPGTWWTHLVLPEALLFLAAGAWLYLRVSPSGAAPVRELSRRLAQAAAGRPSRWALLLLPVLALALEVLGVRDWLGQPWWTGEWTLVAGPLLVVGALFLAFRAPTAAAALAVTGLQVLGVYGIILAARSEPSGGPGPIFGVVMLDSQATRAFALSEGVLLFAAGAFLMPRVIREHQAGIPAAELAARAEQLTQRVETLTQTRTDAVGTAAAELRRIERDLHDGAQARLVALGMSLQAAERLFPTNPQAALALVTEAKETSSRALTDLRDLVRGIYPPVLADRGLADAVRALALDTPLHTEIGISLPDEVDMPVGAAVYFAIAEVLANAVRHSGARTVRIQLTYSRGMLRAQVTDDGAGGADPAAGTGLAGVERRLATFDGILAVSSPPGGPTIVVIEVPCALSSAKTSTC